MVVTSMLGSPPTGSPQVTFNSVSFSKSSWEIHDLNLSINQSDLSMTTFSLFWRKNNQETGNATIDESMFQNLKVTGNFEVNIVKCKIDGTERPGTSLIDINTSNLNIKDSTFKNNMANTGPAIVKAMVSQLTVLRSKFISNYGHYGLIEIMNHSKLLLKNSTFEKNKHFFFMISTILVRPSSSAFLFNTTFVDNMVALGAALCSFPRSNVIVKNCKFLNNIAQKGGAISCHDQFAIQESSVKHNTSTLPLISRLLTHFGYLPTIENIKELNNKTLSQLKSYRNQGKLNNKLFYNTTISKCIIINSKFENNHVIEGGGAIYVQGRTLEVHNSSFVANKGGYGGSLSGEGRANIYIIKSRFRNDFSVMGSSIFIEQSVKLSVDHSFFDYNDTNYATGAKILAFNYCNITVNNSYFINTWTTPVVFGLFNFTQLSAFNTKYQTYRNLGSAVLYAENNIKAHFFNCIFYKNTGIYGTENTIIYILNSTITDSHYVAMDHSILVQYGSHIYFRDTNISENKPSMTQPFIKVAYGSSAKMVNCIYENNARQLHFYVTYDSSLMITDSLIINNTDTYRIVSWVLIQMYTSSISVTNTIFLNNQYHLFHIPFPLPKPYSYIVWIQIGNANFTDCVFKDNQADFVMNIVAAAGPPNGYLQIRNSTFDNHALRTLQVANFADVIIQNSTFEMNNYTEENGNLLIDLCDHIRIAYSLYNSSKHGSVLNNASTQIAILQYSSHKETVELKTFHSTFHYSNHTLSSNDSNFLRKAEAANVIHVDGGLTLDQEETQYASSKYLSLNKISFLPKTYAVEKILDSNFSITAVQVSSGPAFM